MALKDLMSLVSTGDNKKMGLSEERVNAIIPVAREYISFWREYPDIFVEFLCGNNPNNFKLYFYQRVFLRAVMRHRYAYATFPRAYSKSFLSVLVLMLRCILYPGSHLFVTTGGKEQAAGILKEKQEESGRGQESGRGPKIGGTMESRCLRILYEKDRSLFGGSVSEGQSPGIAKSGMKLTFSVSPVSHSSSLLLLCACLCHYFQSLATNLLHYYSGFMP